MKAKWRMKETRKINPWDLRSLCIKHEWYTNGDIEEYDHLLYGMINKENLTTDDICEITQDIIDHSDLNAEAFENVAFELLRIAYTFIEEEK